MRNALAVSIVCKGIGNGTVCICDGDRASTEVKMIGFEGAVGFFPDQTATVDVFGDNAVRGLAEKLSEETTESSHRLFTVLDVTLPRLS